MTDHPPGDDPLDNLPPSTDFTVGAIKKTGKIIRVTPDEQASFAGLRRHNYYNAKNAASLIELVEKWHAMKYEDCYMPARALGLSPDSLRVKLNCARAFVVDNVVSKPEIVDIVRRTEFSLTNLGVVMRLTDKIGGLNFADVMKRGDGPIDPVAECMRWFENEGRIPRAMFVLRDLNLTPGQLEWFRQTLAQCKSEYEGDVNQQQIVIVKLI